MRYPSWNQAETGILDIKICRLWQDFKSFFFSMFQKMDINLWELRSILDSFLEWANFLFTHLVQNWNWIYLVFSSLNKEFFQSDSNLKSSFKTWMRKKSMQVSRKGLLLLLVVLVVVENYRKLYFLLYWGNKM